MQRYYKDTIDKTKYNVQEYPFIGYDQMRETAVSNGASYINHFTWRGYFTIHSCLIEAQIWHDINQDHGPAQLVFDVTDGKWHYEELNTLYQPTCICEKCR